MADFFDNEAEESDDEQVQRLPSGKKKKQRKNGAEYGVDDDDDEEDEEDDEEQIRNEMKDLINDEDEEDDSDDEINRKRKREDEDEDDEDLDDDDLALIEENLGVKLKRKGKKKFRRVRRLDDGDDDEREDTQEVDDREAIANELFDGDDEAPHSSTQRHEESDDRYGRISGSEESEADEDNFIVDDDDRPIARPKKKKGHRYNDEALQQAQDVFGVDFDFDDFENYGDDQDFERDDEEEDEEYADEDDPEGQNETQRSVKKKKGSKRRSVRKSIFEIYEPSELERCHLTEFDNEVRNNDVPERFQLRSIPVSPADEPEIEEEADWIYTNAFNTPSLSIQDVSINQREPICGRKPPAAIVRIREALKFMRNHLLEVPFIAFYRKEYVTPELTIADLWTIYEWDEKWCQLQQRKKNMIKLFTNMQQYQVDQIMKDPDAPLPEGTRLINDSDIERVNGVTNYEELQDCWMHFQIYYSTDLQAMKHEILRKERERRLEEAQTEDDAERLIQEEEEALNRLSSLKLAQRKDTYTICKESGILGLATKFGMNPEQFGENLRDNYQRHEVEQHPIDPNEAAQDYTCSRFPTEDAVLQAARFVVAKQISCDPLVRKCVRQIYFDRAKVHVCPTKKGIKEIDENHPCFTCKYLLNKPITEFIQDQFLQIILAKQDGLLEVRITVEPEELGANDPASIKRNSYFDEIKQLYHRDEYSINVTTWNEQRSEALKSALEKFLYPSFEKEIKNKLMQEAHQGIVKECTKQLNHILRVAPYVPPTTILDDEDFDTRDGVRVMGFAFLPSNDTPAFACMIDGDGEVTDHLRLPYFMMRKTVYASDQERHYKEKDLNRLKAFILNKKPHVIAVGAETITTRYIVEDIKNIIQDLASSEQFPMISVEIVKNDMSSVYMNSKRAITDFHDYPPLLRQAVSLARRLQDPLLEFSQICTADEELLCIKFAPLQDHVPKDDLLNALYLEFVNTVNHIGVDVNRALVHPHTAQLVQFICGLGPRKSTALIRSLKKQATPLLESRTQLVVNCNIGAKVFINCAGFIKIDTAQLKNSGTDTYIEELDSTRVHPEAYEWARKMAVDALEYEDENDVNPAGALEEILENPEKLKDLDLDAFAEELERQGFGNKSITLYDIRNELNFPYKDMRNEYREPNEEEVFQMLTKETMHSFCLGKLITGQVFSIARKKPQSEELDSANPIRNDETGLWKCPFCNKDDFPELSEVWNHFDAGSCPGQAKGIKVKLDNGLIGFIPTKYISDKSIADPAERVQVGMTIHARITKVIVNKFLVDLTCRTSDLVDAYNQYRPTKDQFYDFEMEDKHKKLEDDTKKKQTRQTYIKRIIVHPSFHNIDFKQAEKKLQTMDQGEAIIRPSSKGTDHLTVTWKVYNDINQHVDVVEEGKDNAFSLGHQLFINGEAFEDLDEIIARYIQPMAGFARDLVNFRYFRNADGGKREAMEKIILDEKKKQPSKIHYFISASKEFPGKFVLSYLPRNTVRHEYVSVTPDGYKYRRTVFRSVNSLFRWFKEHFRDPVPQTPASTPAMRTPMGNSSFIGGSGTPGIDHQAIQRAAANMPSHLFNTLSQVAGQTPSFAASSGFHNQQHYYPSSTPNPASTPLMTPIYGSGQKGTPRNYPPSTPQQSGWDPTTGKMPPPSQLPPRASVSGTSRPASRSGMEWKNMAESWSKKRSNAPKTPLYATPGASSQMSISPTSSPNFKGDQTPLVDEWPAE